MSEERCNTCNLILGLEVEYPSLKNLYFLGDKKTNSICCDQCQQEVTEEDES